jgi:thymidylate synthase
MHVETYFRADTLDDLLREVLPELLQQDQEITAGQGDFTELFGVMLVLNNPRARLSRTESKGKIFSALGELFWYLSGTNSYRFITHYLPSEAYKKEDDNDDNSVRSGYGERLLARDGKINQIDNVIQRLRDQSTSRRAVIQLFDATDLTEDFKQIPCTCTLQFIVRDGRLNLLVNMRSNDAFRGLPHDVFAFTMIQELIARSIDVDVGVYKHCAGSLHLYSRDRDGAEAYLSEGWASPIAMGAMPNGDPWDAIGQVKAVEEMARKDQEVDLASASLDPYWMDLCRLFLVFRQWKTKEAHYAESYEACKALNKQMEDKTYCAFIEAKLDSFEEGNL